MVQGRQQVRGGLVAATGAAHGPAVHRDEPASLDGAGARVHPGPQAGVEACGVQAGQDPPDGGLRWQGLALLQAQGRRLTAGQVGGVLPDRCQAPASGRHAHDRQGQDRGQSMTHAPRGPRGSTPSAGTRARDRRDRSCEVGMTAWRRGPGLPGAASTPSTATKNHAAPAQAHRQPPHPQKLRRPPEGKARAGRTTAPGRPSCPGAPRARWVRRRPRRFPPGRSPQARPAPRGERRGSARLRGSPRRSCLQRSW